MASTGGTPGKVILLLSASLLSASRGMLIPRPCHHQARAIVLSRLALDIVDRRRPVSRDDHLFDRQDHRKARMMACQRLGIKPRISLRDLRHYYCTEGAAATGDPTAVARAAGHSIEVAERYQHSDLERARDIARGVEKTLDRSKTTGAEQVDTGAVSRNPLKSLVGARGFEPPASSSQSWRSNQAELRPAPKSTYPKSTIFARHLRRGVYIGAGPCACPCSGRSRGR